MPGSSTSFTKYGMAWNTDDALQIEMGCIRAGGKWKKKNGDWCGEGLSFHYEEMRKILWPHLDCHRWHTLCRDEILKNKVTVLMGPASCGKTHEGAWIYLCEYFCFPEETCVLISSTHIDGLRLRVWAEITMLWQQALDKFDYLPGNLLDSKLLISTDSMDEDEFDERRVRDWRKGIKGIPCVQNGKFVGIGKYCGIKQKRMRLVADEASLMGNSFLSAFSNLDKNEDFRAIVLGNPNDPMDPLGKAAEPLDGWSGHMEPEKTAVWDTRFMKGRCVNLIGTDSPNFDFPEDQPTRYKYLISKEKIENTLSFFPKDSVEYYSQCIGAMKIGILSRRVLTRDICVQFEALNPVVWQGQSRVKIGALDAAYGGDRCVCGHIEFGVAANGEMVLAVVPPVLVPVIVNPEIIPEDQIAIFVKNYCRENGIEPENFYHDSTGRGTLGTSFARIWSSAANPVEFGGAPTDRPVSLDLYIDDPKTHVKRLKTCAEHYSKLVSELWFSVRYVIEGRQMRGLPTNVMEELCLRKWDKVRDGKIELESKSGTPTKPGMKQRTGISPDLADWLSIAVEGARRRGFQIKRLGSATAEGNKKEATLAKVEKEYEDIISQNLLQHA